MSQHGAALQTYNQELVKCLEAMKLRRAELQAQIDTQEDEKNNLQREIEKMSFKLTRLNDSLEKRISARNEYDRTIADTEAAYMKVLNDIDYLKTEIRMLVTNFTIEIKKILESSQILLNMIKREATSLDQTLIKTTIEKQQFRQQ